MKKIRAPKKAHAARLARTRSRSVGNVRGSSADKLDQAGKNAFNKVLKETGDVRAAMAAMEAVAKSAPKKTRKKTAKKASSKKTVKKAARKKAPARATSSMVSDMFAVTSPASILRAADDPEYKKGVLARARGMMSPKDFAQFKRELERRIKAVGKPTRRLAKKTVKKVAKKTAKKAAKKAAKKTAKKVAKKVAKKTAKKAPRRSAKKAPAGKLVTAADVIKGSKGLAKAARVSKKKAAVKTASGKVVKNAGIQRARGSSLGPEKLISVDKIVRKARSHNMRTWICAGYKRSGCGGGGKNGARVVGHLT